jgi:hypothetical protein
MTSAAWPCHCPCMLAASAVALSMIHVIQVRTAFLHTWPRSCCLTCPCAACAASPMQVLVHNRRQLQDSSTLADAAVHDGATISVCSRLRGGGGDGGSTGAESRSCYLEMYAQRKPDKVRVHCSARPGLAPWLVVPAAQLVASSPTDSLMALTA